MPTVLIIDDSLSSNLLIQSILRENGYKTIAAERGHTGLKLISNDFPDLVLLDIMMPDIDGYTVLKQIKEKKRRQLPVIMVSAKKEKEYIQKAFDIGAEDYIIKPIIIKELLEKVNSVLKKNFNSNI